MKFTHVINPFTPKKGHDVAIAQPLAFESLKIAKKFSEDRIEVNQLAIFFEEDENIVPDHFIKFPTLKRFYNVNNNTNKKFPFIKDVLDVAYNNSGENDFIIHSETDIILLPYFYDAILNMINNGFDSIIVNNRSVFNDSGSSPNLYNIWSEVGEPNIGWDCFIFKKKIYEKFLIGDALVGVNSIGKVLYINMRYFSEKFIEVKDSQLTNHLGESESLNNIYNYKKYPFWVECSKFNEGECIKILDFILESNKVYNKNISWISSLLIDSKSRLSRYDHAIKDNSSRYFGYWAIKRLFRFIFN